MPKIMRYVQVQKIEIVVTLPDDDATPVGALSKQLCDGLAVVTFNNMKDTMPPTVTLRDIIIEGGEVAITDAA